MTYEQAMAGVEKGFGVRRKSWAKSNFFVSKRGDDVLFTKSTQAGSKSLFYRATCTEKTATDWELVL